MSYKPEAQTIVTDFRELVDDIGQTIGHGCPVPGWWGLYDTTEEANEDADRIEAELVRLVALGLKFQEVIREAGDIQ